MRGLSVIALLALALLGVTIAPVASGQEPEPGHGLTGHVRESGEAATPVANALVLLERLEDGVWVQAAGGTTGPGGEYAFSDLATGDYRLVAVGRPDLDRSEPFPVTATAEREIVLPPNAPPTVSIAGPERAIRGQAVTFTATPSLDVVRYAWTRDGGQSPDDGTGDSTTVTYDEPGAKSISLVVEDDLGATGEAHTSLLVNHPPTATFTHTADPRAGDTVTFTATGTDADDDPLTFAWDFDADGGFDDGAGATVSRRYPTSGRFAVALRVSDGFETATAAATVVVASAPSPPAPGPVVQPAPPPPAPPPPAPATTAADVTAPRLTVEPVGRRTLNRVRRRGLRFALGCDEPCTVYLEALVGRKTARKLDLGRKRKRIGRLTAESGPDGSQARMKLTRKAAKRLKRLRRVKLTLQGSAWDAGGYATLYLPRKLTLGRGR